MSEKYVSIGYKLNKKLQCSECNVEVGLSKAKWLAEAFSAKLNPYCDYCADLFLRSRQNF
jgi:hypothetical protein